MALEVPPVTAPVPPASTTAPEAASFEERWAAWQARGDAHNRAVRRKLMVAAPFLIAAAAVIAYILAGR